MRQGDKIMTLQSMTGFARSVADHHGTSIAWEVKSVNGKSVELRLRLPSGFERLEPAIRQSVQKRFARGNFQATLTVGHPGSLPPQPVVNEVFLKDVAQLAQRLQEQFDLAPASADGLLALRGVFDIPEPTESEATRAALDAVLLSSFHEALEGLQVARCTEGDALKTLLLGHVDAIEALTLKAEADPSRDVSTIRDRLAAQIRLLMEALPSLDESRLHMEALSPMDVKMY